MTNVSLNLFANYYVREGACSHPWPELTLEETIFPAFLKDSTYISKISD